MRLGLLLAVVAIAPLASAGLALAQDTVTADHVTNNHSVEMLPGGTFKITPNSDDWNNTAQAADPSSALMVHKEWFALKDASGALQAVYGISPGSTLPGEVLAAMGNGYTIQKTAAPTLIGGLMPSADDIRSALEGMLANARDAVCSMGRNKPATFGSNVSVQAGLGISGTIEFTAEWETESLCSVDG